MEFRWSWKSDPLIRKWDSQENKDQIQSCLHTYKSIETPTKKFKSIFTTHSPRKTVTLKAFCRTVSFKTGKGSKLWRVLLWVRKCLSIHHNTRYFTSSHLWVVNNTAKNWSNFSTKLMNSMAFLCINRLCFQHIFLHLKAV